MKSKKMIKEIQDSLKGAADNLEDVSEIQEDSVVEVLAGDFSAAVALAGLAGNSLRDAKWHERKAAKLLIKLIPQMRADGYSEADIFAVTETLIAEFLL